VQEIADRITVIRHGKVIDTVEPSASENQLAELMVGRSVSLTVSKAPAKPAAEPTLEIDNLTVIDDRGLAVVKEVSLDVKGGEILGIAGVQGNGQTELVKALLGLVQPAAGSIRIGGREISRQGPAESLRNGIGYIPEDRQHDGFVGSFTVAENLVLDLYHNDDYSSGIVLNLTKIADNAEQQIVAFDIRTQSASTPTGSLSGGNQQKVILARELSRPLRLLIASQPTRGLDVGSIEFVHKRIVEERDLGVAVLFVSTELDEIAALSDRVAVMYDGRVVDIVDPSTPREDLGLLMAGASPDREGAPNV
jgi:ABC-type uncharacterized transport system ATPase subunit